MLNATAIKSTVSKTSVSKTSVSKPSVSKTKELKITESDTEAGTESVAPDLNPASTWDASLALTFSQTPRGTRLVQSRHCGPLYVQKPLYPEGPDTAHIYLLHPPGGLVSGDSLSLDLQLHEGSHVLFTAPGAARLYRARADGAVQAQSVRLQLGDHASAEWLPQETIVFPGAQGALSTRVALKEYSRFMGWEISCLGLPKNNAPFVRGELKQCFEIFRQNKLVFREVLHLQGTDHLMLNGAAGLQGKSVTGLFVIGPVADNQWIEPLRRIPGPQTALSAITQTGEFIVIRYLGDCSEEARHFFIRCWKFLRPLLFHKTASLPRIWNT